MPEGELSPRDTQRYPERPTKTSESNAALGPWEAVIGGVLESSLGHRAADAAQDTFDADGSCEVGC